MRVRCYDVRVCVNWNIAIAVDPGLNCIEKCLRSSLAKLYRVGIVAQKYPGLFSTTSVPL